MESQFVVFLKLFAKGLHDHELLSEVYFREVYSFWRGGEEMPDGSGASVSGLLLELTPNTIEHKFHDIGVKNDKRDLVTGALQQVGGGN